MPDQQAAPPSAPAANGPGAAPDGRGFTGDRAAWTALADRLLASARRYASPGHARITLPGAEGGYGRDVDGLEGFARTFLIAGFRLAGQRGVGLDELADWYAEGIATGTDPASPQRWVRLTEHGQAKVEAASIALMLDLTRPWIWDRLTPAVAERVVEYLSPAVGDATYPQINWVWFRLVVQTFLRSVGGPWSASEMAGDLAAHDSFRHADGWLSDGATRAFDHYTGWALHLYPTLWARMSGVAQLAADPAAGPLAELVAGRRERDVAALDAYLRDAVTLVGADGSPLLQGRSLIYRFAAAAPFWAGAVAGWPSLSPGQLRYAAGRIVGHFVAHGAPDADGLLSMGWHGPWRRLAQSYSGPGSPYWAAKGLLGIALPADHPVWTDEPVPLPVETGDVLRALPAPGWLVSGVRADGIVRVVNHGTDHAREGAVLADSPLYARLGYSTATCPVLDDSGWRAPVDQSVVLVDPAGATTHRTGMRTLTVRVDGPATGAPVGVAASTGAVHWMDDDAGGLDYGEGRAGRSRPAGTVTVVSLVRGAWEVRLARVEDPAPGGDPAGLRLRVGGWPAAPGLTSRVHSLLGDGTRGDTVLADAGPLGSPVRVPWLDHAVRPGAWVAALIELSGGDPPPEPPTCRVVLDPVAGAHLDVRVEWPDGVRTRTRLDPRTSTGSRTGDR